MTGALALAQGRLAGVVLLLICTACSPAREAARPAWLDGAGTDYPPAQYLVGVGQGDSRSRATERAYEAVARIFRAEVVAQSKDWESYVWLEGRSQSSRERRLTVERVTRVSTNHVLENVRVLDAWIDPRSGLHAVLAGLPRAQTETALLERIRDLDETIQEHLRTARASPDPLTAIRGLKRAAEHLVLREAYNADLRIVRPSGHGHPAEYRVAAITAELEREVTARLRIGVEVSGEQADTIRRAVMEGLVRQGLPVTDREPPGPSPPAGPDAPAPLTLLVKGTAHLWNAELDDPNFRYVRWCADFVVLDPRTDRVVGAVSRQGREGHVTEPEAVTRAVRVMQQALSADLSRTLAGYVYGRDDAPPQTTAPAACQQELPASTTPIPSTIHVL